jgi:uncharacterized membrane protein YfcA
MAREKLEELTEDQLRKKKKIASILIWILVGVGVLSLIAGVRQYVNEELENMSNVVPGIVCLFLALVMYSGKKKINMELENREKE